MSDLLGSLLRDRFGLPGFRARQRPVIDHLLRGGDAVVVWPTGSGKSLVYQLPALALPAPTLVLSPLIALMEDQVAALRARGIAATFINSTVERAERERRADGFAAGRFRLLYVTPERFRDEAFAAAVGRTRVGLLAVDEAHCITTWGHDFRPEYGRLGRIRDRLGRPPTVALTATATPDVVKEIERELALAKPLVDHAGLDRPNLFLAATIHHDEAAKWGRIRSLLRRLPGSGIVYGALIRDLHRLEDELARGGDRLLVYHGDLSREERRAMHRRFQAADGAAPARVLATRAFGMGIDKPDVRFLLHHQLPGSLEELWQEVGRAGRDGEPSYCELLYGEDDLAIQMQFVRSANPDRRLFREVAQRLAEHAERGTTVDVEELRRATTGKVPDGRVETCLAWLAALGVIAAEGERGAIRVVRPLALDEIPDELGAEKERRDLARLQKVVEYVRATRCRRALLDEWFGLPAGSGRCEACDVCVDREEWLAARMAPRPSGSTVASGTSPSLVERAPERGDFVRIDGELLGRVVRVNGSGRGALFEVELATTLETRRFPVRRHRIELLDGAGRRE